MTEETKKKLCEKRIWWTRLKEEAKRQELKTKVLDRVIISTEGAQDWSKDNGVTL